MFAEFLISFMVKLEYQDTGPFSKDQRINYVLLDLDCQAVLHVGLVRDNYNVFVFNVDHPRRAVPLSIPLHLYAYSEHYLFETCAVVCELVLALTGPAIEILDQSEIDSLKRI